jgi:hypothetical protein
MLLKSNLTVCFLKPAVPKASEKAVWNLLHLFSFQRPCVVRRIMIISKSTHFVKNFYSVMKYFLLLVNARLVFAELRGFARGLPMNEGAMYQKSNRLSILFSTDPFYSFDDPPVLGGSIERGRNVTESPSRVKKFFTAAR